MRLPFCLVWSALFLPSVLVGVTDGADNVALFWNLYDAVISGGRILHDVAEGVGAVSKAIRAIDSFLDSTAQAQITETMAKDKAEEEVKSTEEKKPTEEAATTTEGDSSSSSSSNTASSSSSSSSPMPPSISGCGALGLHIRDDTLPLKKMTECCSTHDACYSAACRSNKKDCDGKLRSCLFGMCDDRTLGKSVQYNCRGAAKLLFSGTMALSFQQYNTAQEKLECKKPEKGWKKRR
ncbi:hypothetical protein Pmani_032026 [Petrolisthes manimaculis]|uniref:Uncharacterized protein n=1 Tax=Petrolisthes manimaculis TaxID=1843537 RepID=A0AAE1TRU4_9EUCA|nr:hypothetical protein Pmani_032026 [Petrolisthes manimaculis]